MTTTPRSRTRECSCFMQNHGSCKEHNTATFFSRQNSRAVAVLKIDNRDLTQQDGRRRTVTRGRIRPRSVCFSGAVQMPKSSCVEPNANEWKASYCFCQFALNQVNNNNNWALYSLIRLWQYPPQKQAKKKQTVFWHIHFTYSKRKNDDL